MSPPSRSVSFRNAAGPLLSALRGGVHDLPVEDAVAREELVDAVLHLSGIYWPGRPRQEGGDKFGHSYLPFSDEFLNLFANLKFHRNSRNKFNTFRFSGKLLNSL